MPEAPIILTGKEINELRDQTQLLFDDLYQEKIGGAELGDVFSIGTDDVLTANLVPNGGIIKVVTELALDTDVTDALYYLKTEFINVSAGAADAGKPIVLDAGGLIDSSMLTAAGDVYGPAASTDNAIARFHLATGKIIQNSIPLLDDAGNINFPLDNIGVTFGADTPNALIYFNGTQLFVDVTLDDESPADFRIDNYTSFGNRCTMDDNTPFRWDDGAASWSAALQSEAATGLYISARNRDMFFRTGVNGTTKRLTIEGDGDLIWNPGNNDDDFTIKKNTAGIAYMYDAGDDDHCFGDGGTTNYFKIVGNGDVSFAGTAGFYPRFLTQANEPAAGVGATQCDTSEMVVWKDSDDNKVYLCFNDGGTVKTVELV